MSNKIDDIGIYTNIHESGNKTTSGHKLYYATCVLCGMVVEKRLANIKESNTVCRHKVLDKTSTAYKVNDMPTGWISESKLNTKIYYTWKAMIARTTEKFWNKYPTYIGTTVEESWRMLSNFVIDIKELNGYDQWIKASDNAMMLDKDTLVEGNKHYSKNTCCFISHADSNRDVARRNPEGIQKARKVYIDQHSIPIVLTNLTTGKSMEYSSIKAASRNTGFNYERIIRVLRNNDPDKRTIEDWTVEYAETTVQN